jgi:O-antigen/teichoic acid export membrane protein
VSEPAPSSKGLKEAALEGVRWVTLAKLTGEVAALAAMVALARLVPPAEFGYAAVALIVTMLAAVIAGEGFATPLVQRRTLERAHMEAAAVMSLACCGGLVVLTL